MKIGIVVPFSWSFWGAVVEHAEPQAAALEELGHDVRLVMGNDPPGQFTRVLHPRVGRHGDPPRERHPGGRSVIVPANGSLPNIVLSPRTYSADPTRARARAFRCPPPPRADDADDLPVGAHARARCPLVATFHASGELGWMKCGMPVWGFLDRPDRPPHRRLGAREGVAEPLAAGRVRGHPERRARPERRRAGGREHRIVFAGRQEPRKGLQVLLRAWPEIHGAPGSGSRSRAPTRSRSGSSSRGFAFPTTASTSSAS